MTKYPKAPFIARVWQLKGAFLHDYPLFAILDFFNRHNPAASAKNQPIGTDHHMPCVPREGIEERE